MAFIFAGKMNKTKYLGIASEKWIFLFASLITFAVCGLWHGEGVNFLIWGLLFGIYLITANWSLGFNKRLRKTLYISKKSQLYRIYSIVVTFILVSFAWIFFRANNAQEAIYIIKSIFNLKGSLFLDIMTIVFGLVGIALLLFIESKREYGQTSYLPFKSKHWFSEYLAYGSLIIIILLIGVFDNSQFIYFQF
jgi:D-alanyl-lipoteichoic acid acyltransferase DltB (MBOAT superfamily)